MNMGFGGMNDESESESSQAGSFSTGSFMDEPTKSGMPGAGDDGASGTGQNESAGNMSLVSSLSGGPEGLPEADDFAFIDGQKTKSRLMNQTSLMVVMLALVAGTSIFAMRMTQGEVDLATDQEAEIKIEKALARFNEAGTNANGSARSFFGDTEDILSVFSVNATEVQVPSEYLAKNPFTFTRPEKVVIQQEVVISESAQDRRMRELNAEFSRLSLDTVMHGRVPVAIINGQLLQVGHEVGSFKVAKISGMSVVLTANDQLFQLSMEQDGTMNAPKRGGYSR